MLLWFELLSLQPTTESIIATISLQVYSVIEFISPYQLQLIFSHSTCAIHILHKGLHRIPQYYSTPYAVTLIITRPSFL